MCDLGITVNQLQDASLFAFIGWSFQRGYEYDTINTSLFSDIQSNIKCLIKK